MSETDYNIGWFVIGAIFGALGFAALWLWVFYPILLNIVRRLNSREGAGK